MELPRRHDEPILQLRAAAAGCAPVTVPALHFGVFTVQFWYSREYVVEATAVV